MARFVIFYVVCIFFWIFSMSCEAEESAYVTLGDKWPLTVKEGEVGCDTQAAFFRHKGKKYALNGIASSRRSEYLPVEPIWAVPEPVWVDDPEHPGEKFNMAPPRKDIGPLIGLALEKCQ